MSSLPGRALAGPTGTNSPMLLPLAGGSGAVIKLGELVMILDDGEEIAKGQLDEQRDVTILRSLPGVGRSVLATLLAEATDALRRLDYHALRCLSGVAPVTKRSGKSKIVLMRQAAHVRLRNAVYHWARTAVQHDQRSRVEVRRSPGSWAWSWPSAPLNRRSIARRRLRHARNQNHLRSRPPREKDFSRRMIPLYKRWGVPPPPDDSP